MRGRAGNGGEGVHGAARARLLDLTYLCTCQAVRDGLLVYTETGVWGDGRAAGSKQLKSPFFRFCEIHRPK